MLRGKRVKHGDNRGMICIEIGDSIGIICLFISTTTLSSYESSKMAALQIGHMPLYSISSPGIER